MLRYPFDHSKRHSSLGSQWPAWAGGGIVAVSSVIYIPAVYRTLGSFLVLAIYDVCVAVAAMSAAVLAVRLWGSFERGETLSSVWGSIAIGLILWAGGELIWSSDQLWRGESLPYPSTADVLWILGYLPILWGLWKRYSTLRIRLGQGWQWVVLAIYGLSVALAVFWILVPIMTDTSTTRIFEKTINLLYPIGDLMVSSLGILLVVVLLGGSLFKSWGLIALGFICVASSDLLYALTLWQGTYQVNPAEGGDFVSVSINLLYVIFYVLVAVGSHQQARALNAA